MVVFYAMNRDFTYVCLLAFVTVNAILLSYVTNSDRTIGALKPALPLSNSTDQMVRLQSVISNHSDDIKAIRNSTSAQIQVLKSIAQGFAVSSAQIMFATLAVFLLGVTLVIYGLRLTLRGPKQTSRYFKAIMCALLSPVIVIIMAYQLGIAFRAPLEIYEIAPPLLIISLLLWIPTGVIIFLLVADRKLMQHLEQRQ
ncbi:MAG: hypothetical protein WAK17_02875 [Candidatus Nitrosopolaris sp.]|jgi:hypothetical protein